MYLFLYVEISVTFKALSIWYNTPKTFFPLFKTVLNSSILMFFSASAVFCFTSSPECWNVSLWGHFSPGETNKKKLLEVRGSYHFCSKTAEHSVWCGQVCSKSPSWNRQTRGVSQKEHWCQCSPSQWYQLVHWYRLVPRTLT